MKKGYTYVTRPSMPPYEEYIEAVKPLWESGLLTNMGCFHQRLEEKLKEYLDISNVSLTVNGHMALELVLQAMGFPEGAEIITTPFTFISTTHAIIRNHLKPVFCDIKSSDGTLDETKIESLITERTAAIVPVHVYGNVCNIEQIQKIADKYCLKVIYDAAHAFGVTYKEKGIGSYGDASIFSFHATKVFNTVEGGAAVFSDPGLYERMYNLKNFGIRGEELVTEIGLNAKMNEFCAIMGLCNLKHIDHAVEERKARYEMYRTGLKDVKGVRLFQEKRDVKCNYAYMPILIENHYSMGRDELYQLLKENGFICRKYFYPLTCDHVCFENKYKEIELKNARELSKRVLTLPLYEELEMEAVKEIIRLIRDFG